MRKDRTEAVSSLLLSPGRAWTARLQPSALTLKQIRQRVMTHLQQELGG